MLGALLAVALGAVAPAAADARPPRITQAPVVAGTAQVGATLEAQGAAWESTPEPTISWQWVRCANLGNSRPCDEIDGATGIAYTATAADLGKQLRVQLVVSNEDGSARSLSDASAAVAAAPAPEPSPEPSPPPAPEPSPAPASDASPEPSPALVPEPASAAVAPAPAPAPTGDVRGEQAAKPPRLMSPAPIVRIRGRLTRTGARITLLTVRAPRGAAITVRCAGKRCPARRWARTASLTRIARFQAALPAGTRLTISVTKPGRIGKHTTILIRRGKAPTRLDRCLMPGKRKPVACPA